MEFSVFHDLFKKITADMKKLKITIGSGYVGMSGAVLAQNNDVIVRY